MQISISYLVEGSTDTKFLQDIILRTFESIAYDCKTQVDILPLNNIPKIGDTFVSQVLNAAAKSIEDFAANIFCVHSDADADTANATINNKIYPAKIALAKTNPKTHCHNIVAIIPVQETEAWMLADTDLFRREIGTKLNNVELDIHRQPETIADPKETIITAIRTANQNLTKRRRHELSIGDLYESIGSKIDLSKLRLLPSFQAFEREVREAFKFLGLL